MNKLPLIRNGQGFDYTVLNKIITAINNLIIDKPGYDVMMNDLISINNNYTSKIDSFISQYKDIVNDTPTMIELLKAYADLKDKCNNVPDVKYDISSVALDFVKNTNVGQELYKGLFKIVNGVPDLGAVIVDKGKSVLAASEFDEVTGDPINDSSSVFIQCADITDISSNYSWLCLDTIKGPEGQAGTPGPTGAKGDQGDPGEDGQIVNIRGTLGDITEDNILNKLNNIIANEKDLKTNDAYVYDNEKDPKIFVYTPNGNFQDAVYGSWTIIRNIRGPEGPEGKSKTIRIGFSEDISGPPLENIDNPDDLNKCFYMWIAIMSEEDVSNNVVPDWKKIRFRGPDIIFDKATISWTYNSADGEQHWVAQDGTNGSSKITNASLGSDKAVTKNITFNFKDPQEIKAAKIKDKQLILTKGYVHSEGQEPKPKTTDIVVDGFVLPAVDNKLDAGSINPVQNKVIKAALDNKANINPITKKIDIEYLPETIGKFISGEINSETRFTVIDKDGNRTIHTTDTTTEIHQLPESNATYISSKNLSGDVVSSTFGWSGEKFVPITRNLVIGTTKDTAYDGAAGATNAYNINSILTGEDNSHQEVSVGAARELAVDHHLTMTIGTEEKKFNGSNDDPNFTRNVIINPSTIGALPSNGTANNAVNVTNTLGTTGNTVNISDVFTSVDGKLNAKVKAAAKADLASKATSDDSGDGQTISTKYATKKELETTNTNLSAVKVTAEAAATKQALQDGLASKQNTIPDGTYAPLSNGKITSTYLSNATTSQKGIIQLAKTTDTTSTDKAATPKQLADGLATKQPKGEYATKDDVANHKVTMEDLLDLIYPIGSVYMTTDTFNPHDKFGGTWDEFESGYYVKAGKGQTAGTDNTQKLPNITGTLDLRGFAGAALIHTPADQESNKGAEGTSGTGAFGGKDSIPSAGDGHYAMESTAHADQITVSKITFNASDSDSIYQSEQIVQPKSLTLHIWKRIA